MRTALSNILGEYVEASDLTHGDTADFQVVCPCCRESVFKVARPEGRRRGATFFSHRKSTAETEECERRVASLSRAYVAQVNEAARGQTLEAFLRVLPAAISLDRVFYAGRDPDKVHRQMQGDAGWRFLTGMLVTLVQQPIHKDPEGRLEQTVLRCFRSLDERADEFHSAYARSFQSRLAKGIYRYLQGPEARPVLERAIRHVLWGRYVYIGQAMADGTLTEADKGVRDVLATITLRDDASRLRRFGKLMWAPDPGSLAAGHHPVSVMKAFTDAVEVDLVFLLLRLPYRRMAENLAQGRKPLDSLEPCKIGLFGLRSSAEDGARNVEAQSMPARPRPPVKEQTGHLLSLHVAPAIRRFG